MNRAIRNVRRTHRARRWRHHPDEGRYVLVYTKGYVPVGTAVVSRTGEAVVSIERTCNVIGAAITGLGWVDFHAPAQKGDELVWRVGDLTIP